MGRHSATLFPMVQKQKKSPSEYPMFAFRLTSAQKDELNQMLEDLRASLNERLEPNQKLWMKNDLIYEALKIGLPKLKPQSRKKK